MIELRRNVQRCLKCSIHQREIRSHPIKDLDRMEMPFRRRIVKGRSQFLYSSEMERKCDRERSA